MQAPERFALTLRGDTDKLRQARPEQWDQINYLLNRLLRGEPVSVSELEYYGMTVEFLDDDEQ